MSKADQLGTGRSFGQVPRGRSARGRAKAVAQGDVPTYELVRLHLDEVSPTPLNPRRNFGTDEELTRFGEELRQAQLAACVAVSRDAYLALWPDHEERIGPVKHVLINGERRYRSGLHVGLDALDFVVRDDLASSREEFINHLLKENLDREDFDVIERARGVQQLVDICAEKSERGARSRAAEQLGKDRSWVTNQLSLLELPEEIQAMLSAGSLAERDGRLLARHLKDSPGLDAAALLEHLEQTKSAVALAKEQDKAALEAARRVQADAASVSLSADNNHAELEAESSVADQSAGLLSADNKPAGTSGSLSGTPGAVPEKRSAGTALLSADNKPQEEASAAARPGVPEQQRNRKTEPSSIVLRDPHQIAADLKARLTLQELAELTELLVEHVAADEDS
ncbi:ParB/RepB/Spo0J family partition protein [Streptomyces griseorubiginosus]|uniref:Plasmid partitioning protein n=1 Tax=Streptomyces griseorubiginosus TaxID=67304 RepID=A0A101RMZ7_9ACTN|nr:ParB/RepB/Spo0J family partition protein [Streptomyces griseorubiginosus]KUN58450.1 plasmid partitioning protein [Streptomyces griseorubiginosus]